MVYMILLGILILGLYFYISLKQNAWVNGLLITTASLTLFNVILPILYQYNNADKNYDYQYILIYYGVQFISLSLSYYYFSQTNRLNFEYAKEVDQKTLKVINKILLITILFIAFVILINIPFEYMKNPRLLYEKTRLGFGHIYFVVSALITLYLIFTIFTSKKYYYLILVMVLFYFTGSKAKMILPIEIIFLYYFYVKSKDRNNIKKMLFLGLGVVIIFLGVYTLTSYYLPDKNIQTIINSLSGYSDYNRNFLMLIEKLGKSNEYFGGLISLETNFVSLIPRVLWNGKPEIFGSFRLSYMIYPEWTLLFQGAPSFGPFGDYFADFGHWSLIIISIQNIIMGCCLAISEKNFIKHKNPITFMAFIIFIGMPILDIGLSSITIIIINLIFVGVLYYCIRFLEKKIINRSIKSKFKLGDK